MNRITGWKALLYLSLIFVAGIVTGAIVATAVARHNFMLPPRPGRMSETILEQLKSRLGLTDGQAAQIKPILEDTGKQMEQVHTETMQRCDKLMEDSNKRMAEYLTPEQKQKLLEMEKERQKRVFPHHGSPHGPPPGEPFFGPHGP